MNIIITGASRGIGFELAKQFAANGNHNILAISRDSDKLKVLKNACIRENVAAHLYPIPFDLASSPSLDQNLVTQIQNHLQHVDILINNAGYLSNSSLMQLSDTEMWQMVKVNFMAPAQLIRLVLPLMRPGSHVVNIGSMGGFQGSAKFAGLSVYSATKAALASLTECLAEEMKDTGVKFNCLALGAVSTEMLVEAFPGYSAPINAEQIAKFIVDFALTGSNYFNGKVIPVSTSTP
jgi:short-subunit dehydrogenase